MPIILTHQPIWVAACHSRSGYSGGFFGLRVLAVSHGTDRASGFRILAMEGVARPGDSDNRVLSPQPRDGGRGVRHLVRGQFVVADCDGAGRFHTESGRFGFEDASGRSLGICRE